MTASARITAAPGGRLPELRGEGPLAVRRTRATGPRPRVCLVGAMSAPLNGDRLALTVTVLPGAGLHVVSAAACVALPGARGDRAEYLTELHVGGDAELHWTPEPLISARGSDLYARTRIHLAPGARLHYREEHLAGRAGEEPGRLVARLTVYRAGRVLLDQETSHGPDEPGWRSGAVMGGRRAAGQILRVDPAAPGSAPGTAAAPTVATDPGAAGLAARMSPAGDAILVSAVADDGLGLRHLLDRMDPSADRAPTHPLPAPAPEPPPGSPSDRRSV
ncbi:urease accessory protein UreD [Streptomyces sp. ST2-7A]|uniref:urease accessory protein UreD n=1 Tax=Streptomyces sp. ST2-7A TaxID=2907214 RepID=UPI001F296E44|nr:urease accessory protein UreD [Streptomyces sp. ST2-7A]MCE7080785.1 urease accessory protein UreD [Streptomyces sp. ST2-7A]